MITVGINPHQSLFTAVAAQRLGRERTVRITFTSRPFADRNVPVLSTSSGWSWHNTVKGSTVTIGTSLASRDIELALIRAARPWCVLSKAAHGFVIGRDLALSITLSCLSCR